MRNNDTKRDYREMMAEAFAANDAAKIAESFEVMNAQIFEEVEAKLEGAKMDSDKSILAQRGVRQLTTEEKSYYEALSTAMRSETPKQALSNTNLVMPQTVINAVFEDLVTAHPLLSKIDFAFVRGTVKMLMNTNTKQEATWGALCSEIVKEITSGFKEVDTSLLKLSAFLPVCKATLELGFEWLDSYVRQCLYEALANGLENGIINGDGNGKPIGMIRDVSDDASVVGNAYPQKDEIAITDLGVATIGSLLAEMAVDANGKFRTVEDVILIVNPADYYTSVMPATTIMAPDGTYRSDVLPFPITIIPSAYMATGKAIIGMAKRYYAVAAMDKAGRIEYSDQYQFLEDNRVYLIKLYANAMPKDDNAFKYLDISGLTPAILQVKVVTDTNTEDAGE